MRTKRKLPSFKTREAEARFWDTHSMADYVHALDRVHEALTPAPALADRIKQRTKTRTISLRLPQWEIDGAKRIARLRGVAYQALLKDWIAESLRREAQRRAEPR